MISFHKIVIAFLLTVGGFSFTLSAQEGNIWYFGHFAGLDFNSGSVTALTDGAMDTQEGCASISNKSGNLLFYTSGVTVFNRNHTAMPNGTGLLGNSSSTQSAIIIPNPGDSNLFYIFTTDCAENLFANGYNYSVVDMRLDGGLGNVTSQKNINLYSPSTERLTAVKAANGIDYWVITKDFDNNRFTVYKVDCSGINLIPVVSDVGVPHTENQAQFTGTGQIKASPNGKKVCVVTTWPVAMAQLFDFDNNTGVLSNPISLTGYITGFSHIYGVEFSPNSKLLYISTAFSKTVNQYDISSGNSVLINASRYIIPITGFAAGALQLTPDKRIFLAIPNIPFVSTINNPDVYGAGCNFSLDAISLSGKICGTSLPAYIASFFDASNHIDFTSSFVDCHVQFSGTTDLAGNLTWDWDFGDGSISTGQVVNHSYRQVGTYNVTLKVKRTVAACSQPSTDSFTITHPITINNVFAVDFNKTGNCFGDVFSFTNNTVLTLGSITGYSWDFGDGSPLENTQNATHSFAATGSYDVKLVVSTNGICNADSIIKKIFVDTKPTAIFSPLDGCINTPVSFTDGSTNTTGGVGAWLWSFGDGGTSLLQNPTHAYAAVGPYVSRLTVESLHGCVSDEVTGPLNIFALPVADYNITYPCVGQGTVFTDATPTNNGNITAWQWDFGDTNNSGMQNPTHIYNNATSYSTSLIVKSQYGCFSSPKIVPVNINKVIAFAGNDTTATYDVPFQLQATGGTTYEWMPVRGLNNPFIAKPIAVLRDDITYTVKVTDINGCFSTDDVFVKVYANNDVLVPNSFTPNGDGVNDILKPLGFGLKKIEYFRIYNRYGQLVFETRELDKGWDGTFNGKQQPSGTYTFMVSAVNYRNRVVEKAGTVLIIR